VRRHLRVLLETLRPNPAYITSRTLDVLAANPGAMALYAGLDEWPAAQRNIGRFLFLHPAARDVYADWDNQIRGCVARLRALAGTDPDCPRPGCPRRRTAAQEPGLRQAVGTL
jgi:hypothetical protein